MITPLVQRQIFQTASVESVRLAAEGHGLVQQEQARKQSFDTKLAEALVDVPDVEEADVLRLADRERKGRQQGQGSDHLGGTETEAPAQDPAEGAGSHVDLLA